MSKVSVIIVNHNRRDFLKDCLTALGGQTLRDIDVVLVDNGSSDDSLHVARRLLEESPSSRPFEIVASSRNLGFAGGNLEGLKRSRGEYVALLNNDAFPDETWLEELVKAMDVNPDVGICASRLIVDGADRIDSAGDGFSTSLKGFKRGEGQDIHLFDKKQYTFGACAGAALYRRKMIDEIGFLDEDFFLIHEDTDLNLRAQLHGWKVLYVPTAVVYHKVRSSIGPMSDTAIYYTLRNSEFVRIKNIPFGVFIRCLPEFLIGAFTEFIYFAIKHKRFRLYFKAKMDAIRVSPRMFEKRTLILKNRRVNHQHLLSVMTSVWQKDFLITRVKKFLCA